MKEYNRFTASKRLSRIRPCIRSSYMSLDTIWCRVAYACLEDDSFFQNAHSFYELHYVTNGVQRIGIEDREPVLLNTGNLICIPPHSPHFTQHMNKETVPGQWRTTSGGTRPIYCLCKPASIPSTSPAEKPNGSSTNSS